MPLFLSVIPQPGQPIVVSIPGSGTRSLLAQTGITCNRHVPYDEKELLHYREHEWHVPIRNPLAHSRRTPLKKIIRGWAFIIRHCLFRRNVTFYRTNKLKYHLGKTLCNDG